MSDPAISVLFRRRGPAVKPPLVRKFARDLSRELAGARPFTCLITSDEDLRRLHCDFLAKDYPTDVLSFPTGAQLGTLGDVAISLDRARVQARERGHSLEDEVRILMLHGVLHLLGHDHETDRGRMRRLETAWRMRLGLPDGLIQRWRR